MHERAHMLHRSTEQRIHSLRSITLQKVLMGVSMLEPRELQTTLNNSHLPRRCQMLANLDRCKLSGPQHPHALSTPPQVPMDPMQNHLF